MNWNDICTIISTLIGVITIISGIVRQIAERGSLKTINVRHMIYFRPALSVSNGNTSSLYIDIEVKNSSVKPIYIVKALIKDKYSKSYGDTATILKEDYKEDFLVVDYYEGDYVIQLYDAIAELPLEIKPNEDIRIKLILPCTGNNLHEENILMNEDGSPKEFDCGVKLVTDRKKIFGNKCIVVKGKAFAAQRCSKECL